jgi:hypothetical protein
MVVWASTLGALYAPELMPDPYIAPTCIEAQPVPAIIASSGIVPRYVQGFSQFADEAGKSRVWQPTKLGSFVVLNT